MASHNEDIAGQLIELVPLPSMTVKLQALSMIASI